ncbi:MAG: uroporphyrinogen-III C-methyltransferase [Gammaproteobacteria bacterium]|nr:uroporphyrinogen-III C-methyltransferase [Gammaproteobacteria bacterium]
MADKEVKESGIQQNEVFARLEAEKDDTVKKPPPPPPSSPPPPRTRSRSSGLFTLLLALIATGLGGYAVYTQFQQQRTGADETLRLSGNLDQLRLQVEQGISQAAAVEQQLDVIREAQNSRIQDIESALASAQEQINASRTTTGRDWLLAEVEYLLRMANQRILMDRDPAGAVSLLHSSDRILANAEDLTAHGLRAAIALDIAGLQAAGDLDVEGIYLRIGAQINLVDDLVRPVPQYSPEMTDAASTDETGVEDGGLTGMASQFGQTLFKLVDFRRNIPEVMPILPPEEEYYLRQNLILKLQMAQLALLREKQQVFQSNIAEAVDWLDRYFKDSDGLTIAMRQSLEELRSVEVLRILPDVSRSLREVRQLLSDFHRQDAAGKTDIQGENTRDNRTE